MINTPRQIALSREMAAQAASRECLPTCAFRGAEGAKPHIRHDAAKQACFGRRSGIICPIFRAAPMAPRGAKGWFSRRISRGDANRMRTARGDINESAELLITAAPRRLAG